LKQRFTNYYKETENLFRITGQCYHLGGQLVNLNL